MKEIFHHLNHKRSAPSSYIQTMKLEDDGGGSRVRVPYVTATCATCSQTTEIRWSGGADPGFVEKKFRQNGWHFDAYKPKSCVCPGCSNKREREATPRVWADVAATLTSEETMKTSANSIKNIIETPMTATAVAQAGAGAYSVDRLTRHQKARIRELLDTNFDDEKGRYIDGFNDERIGKEVSVPWALVTEIREKAYGPIQDDPAVVSFKADLASMQEELKVLSNAVEAARATTTRLEGRMVNLEAKAKKL